METEEGSPSQTSGSCHQDTKSAVSKTREEGQNKSRTNNKEKGRKIGSKEGRKERNNQAKNVKTHFSPSGVEPSPALLISPGCRRRRSSTQERKDTPTEKLANEETAGRPQEKRPGEGNVTSISCTHIYAAMVNLRMYQQSGKKEASCGRKEQTSKCIFKSLIKRIIIIRV